MKTLYNEEYAGLYQKLLAGVKGMDKDSELSFHFCCCGKNFMTNPEKKLMIVGRALNGYGNTINSSIEEEMHKAADSNHNLKFIDEYGSKSAFWRVTRDVSKRLGLAGIEDWYDNLAWSNLYKIAPHKGGNPKEKLCQAQFELCNKILKHEINVLQPKYILIMTGYWFEAFNRGFYNQNIEIKPNDRLPFNINYHESEKDSIVIGTSTIGFDEFLAKVVVCHRPEARKGGEEKSKKEIIEAF